MRHYNIHQAKTHLSRLVDMAAAGEPFVIAKAGKPLVKVIPLETEFDGGGSQFGFLKGEIVVPEDFDSMFAEEIEKLFTDGD